MSTQSLNILSLNVNGLNSAIKRTCVLEYLHRKKVDIALIQEMHLKQCDVARFQNKHYRLIISSRALNKTKGVCILFNRKVSCEVNVIGNDENGRLAFARVNIFNHKLVFTSVYCPNEPDGDFFSYIGNTLLEQNDCSLVVGGDFIIFLIHLLINLIQMQ